MKIIAVMGIGIAIVAASACGEGTSGSSSNASGGGDTVGGVGGAAKCFDVFELPHQAPHCATSCVSDDECCSDGKCGDYPNNNRCIGNFCRTAQCCQLSDCGVKAYEQVCAPVKGLWNCLIKCASEAQCQAIASILHCNGVSDGGEKYCVGPSSPCKSPADCVGYGDLCDVARGECYCADDAQCTSLGLNVCAK